MIRFAAAMLLVLAGCEDPTGPERPISGERLFSQYCARCHGTDGHGDPSQPGIRDLGDPAVMATIDDMRIRRAITMGVPPKMPAFGAEFTEASVKVLAAFVRGLSVGPGSGSGSGLSAGSGSGSGPAPTQAADPASPGPGSGSGPSEKVAPKPAANPADATPTPAADEEP